jgi:hypothetical protein
MRELHLKEVISNNPPNPMFSVAKERDLPFEKLTLTLLRSIGFNPGTIGG